MTGSALGTPLDACVVDGEVVLSSQETAACVSLTPEAALQTAQKLAQAARTAQFIPPQPGNDAGPAGLSVTPRTPPG